MKHLSLHRLIHIGILYMMLAALSMILLPGLAQAHRNVAFSVPSAPSGHVTIMVLDMSGSMSQNDPDGLRCSAANAYIDLSGPGSFIGVIGLDGNGNRGGPHNFQLAQHWQDPVEMNTLRARQSLQQEIAQKSNHCSPDSTTPTYDSLNQALNMLTNATNGGQISGSVILLTDGVPDPDTQDQINAIQADLVPQFKQHKWPIDAVALGAGDTNFNFLKEIANSTSGNFYQDNQGAVPGVSPLNIAPFFVEIFAQRNGRAVHKDIAPTQLNGGASQYNFDVAPYTKTLDLIVVKDQRGTTAGLRTPPPDNRVVQPGPGVFVSSADPHYIIYSIARPKEGTWELDMNGSGQFLADDLHESDVKVSIATVTQANLKGSTDSSVLPLGQPITVTAYLTSNGQAITDDRFTLSGTITYSGGFGNYTKTFALDDKANPGTYVGHVTVPDSAPPGTYTIRIDATGASANAVIASDNRSIRIELFPVPFFLDQKTHQPTQNSVSATVIEWDPVLRIIYGIPLWPFQKLSEWPLQNLPAVPSAVVSGQIELQGQPYTGAAVNATATRVGSKDNIPVTVINDGQGQFHVQFQPLAAGSYNVNFQTSGSFQQSHGDFGATTRTVQLNIQSATAGQEFTAWLRTLLYLFFAIVIYYIMRFLLTPRPFGEWVQSYEGDIQGRYGFNNAHRGPRQWFFHRNLLSSKQANMPRGLEFRFQHGGGIQVRPDGPAGEDWRAGNGAPLRADFQEVRELVYSPSDDGDDSTVERSTYSIFSRADRKNIGEEIDDDYDTRSSRKGSRRMYDDDYDDDSSSGRRRSRRAADEYDDYDDNRSGRNRRQSRQRQYSEYDDE